MLFIYGTGIMFIVYIYIKVLLIILYFFEDLI